MAIPDAVRNLAASFLDRMKCARLTSRNQVCVETFSKTALASGMLFGESECKKGGMPAGVPVWYTAVVPLPLALPDLMQRLRSNYYRDVKALQHDASTIASNAELFNGANTEVAKTAAGESLCPCALGASSMRACG